MRAKRAENFELYFDLRLLLNLKVNKTHTFPHYQRSPKRRHLLKGGKLAPLPPPPGYATASESLMLKWELSTHIGY